MEEKLFTEMTKAIEKAHEKELEFLIASREARQLKAAYTAFIEAKRKGVNADA